ncbi:hypothetical protein [uncultured Nonlabens sp.]|uniref:hypothetical protein n=1 Tax=uncultured Nonlabens sp. TaxID=859306 RepID=UPI0030DA0928|tara:strand:- start:1769 stop:2515 length:747 start_codon:yes stop_codon:yes gene_type:complete
MLFKTITSIFLFLFLFNAAGAQVGIGTDSPEAALDVNSADSGMLIPRIALSSVTPLINPNGGPLVEGTMVWNTGTADVTPTGFYLWETDQWNLVVSENKPQVFIGRMVISAGDNMLGTKTITGIPFSPRTVEFTAISNTESVNDGYERSDNGNNGDNSVGYTFGYAKVTTTAPFIEQIAISGAASGASINRVGNYSSTNRCFAAQFVNQNADDQGRTSASMQSFTSDGFVLSIDEFTDPVVVLIRAYR